MGSILIGRLGFLQGVLTFSHIERGRRISRLAFALLESLYRIHPEMLRVADVMRGGGCGFGIRGKFGI